jgi:hypothetical protein
MSHDAGASPGASVPRTDAVLFEYGSVTYVGPRNFWGDSKSVTQIHRTNRLYDFLTTVTIAILVCVICGLATFLAIYAPADRDRLIWAIAVVSWILAIGLGGFAAFQISLSEKGLRISGSEQGKKSGKTEISEAGRPRKP